MNNISIADMLEMQQRLREIHKNKWDPMEPKYAKSSLLWMTAEIGEVIDIIKKCGDEKVMQDQSTRAAFVEEMGDVLMYFHDILLRFGVTADEFSSMYLQKHAKNMGRDYAKDSKAFLEGLSGEGKK